MSILAAPQDPWNSYWWYKHLRGKMQHLLSQVKSVLHSAPMCSSPTLINWSYSSLDTHSAKITTYNSKVICRIGHKEKIKLWDKLKDMGFKCHRRHSWTPSAQYLQQVSTETHLLGVWQTKSLIIYETSKTKHRTNPFETKLTWK